MIHTEHTKDDILFHDVPNEFIAIVGHKERALTLPKNAIVLGSTEKCPYHSFKLKDKNFYAFQYHPEMDKIDFTARLDRYCKKYPFDEKFNGIQSLKDQVKEISTEHSNGLLEKFIKRILLKDQ